MGCDIHMFAEVRNSEGGWDKVDKIFDSTYYRPDEKTETLEDGYIWNDPKTDEPYEGRNYVLFAILADVRNGYGFAGVRTHDPVVPLFAGRGIPSDASAEYKQIVEDWDIDGHSHTYATLAELQAVDWHGIVIKQSGYLSIKEYERIRGTDLLPEYWCGDTSSKKMTAQAYENNFRGRIEASDQGTEYFSPIYIYCEWVEPLMRSAEEFVEESIPQLEKLGKPEDVRVVFFFDN